VVEKEEKEEMSKNLDFVWKYIEVER